MSTFLDNYQPSRLLLPELYERLPLQGRPVVIAATPRHVFVAGDQEVEALNVMAAFAEEEFSVDSGRGALAPFVLDDGAWREFEPQDEALAAVLALSVKQRIVDYEAQTEPLQAQLDAAGWGGFVPRLENGWDGARLRTWSSWLKEAPTLMPRADVLGLVASKDRILRRRWEDVEAVCGPFKAEDGMYPPRYLPDRWPDDAAWKRLEVEFAAPPWMSA